MISQRKISRVVATLLAGGLFAGCQLLSPKQSTSAIQLPDLSKATRALSPGEAVDFRETRLTINAIEGAGVERTVRWTLESDDTRRMEQTPLNAYSRAGDLLVQFQAPANEETGGRPLVRLFLYYLPELTGRPARGTERVEVDERGVIFFSGGFLALEGVTENSYSRTDDDSATISAMIGDRIETREIEEFHDYPLGGKTLRILNIYPGEVPGEGRMEVHVIPQGDEWAGAIQLPEVEVASGEPAKVENLTVTAEPVLDESDPNLVYIRISDPRMQERSYILHPGESVRVGRFGLLVDRITGDGVAVIPYAYDKELRPFAGRMPGVLSGPKVEKPVTAAEPMVTLRKINLNEQVVFHGATFRLTRTLDYDPTSLSDDRAEFTIEHDNNSEALVVKEGNNYTVHGAGRWWVIEAVSIDAQDRWGANAVVRLRTGTYLGMQEASSPSL